MSSSLCLVLDSAYALYDRDFLSNFGSVLLYAVVGTLFNVFSIGFLIYLLYYIGAMGNFVSPLDPISCLIFSSLISAVDPVAVLAIFEEIGVNMELYFLVFGESLLNDGVTVVLYNTMVALSGQDKIEYDQYILAFFSFFTVVLGGLAIGVIVGIMSALILKFTMEVRVIEPLIVFSTAYFAFILAECSHWSGIISLIGCGIAQKRYAFPNVSKKSYTTIKYGIKTLASFCDCIIFLFLGIVTISHDLEWHTGFVIWTLVLCFAIS
jgi:sodium/hydrogen exchanger 3